MLFVVNSSGENCSQAFSHHILGDLCFYFVVLGSIILSGWRFFTKSGDVALEYLKEPIVKHRAQTLSLFPLLTIAVLLILLAGSLNARSASAASSVHTSGRAQHVFAALPIKLSTETSLNWSGYAASGAAGTFTQVSAKWMQPTVKCSSATTYSVFWVGLDGFNSDTVEQTGSGGDCVSGSPVYYAWYEVYPKEPIETINKPVSAGDIFSASATEVTSTSFKLVISDSTQKWTFSTTQTLTGAKLSSAEVIAEAPSSSGGVLPLADFGTVNFRSAMVNGESIGSFSPTEIVMETSNKTVKAQPSALSGGTAFSITWKHS